MKNVSPYFKNVRTSNYYQSKKDHISIFLLLLFALFTPFVSNAQLDSNKTKAQINFEQRMDKFIRTYIKDSAVIESIKNRPNDIHDHESFSDEQILDIAKDQAKQKFIITNYDEYLNTYFNNSSLRGSGDTLICDNGGFENDFDYYEGFITVYDYGSDSCAPHDTLGLPATFVQTTMPLTNRFQIVTTGSDPLTGIDQVKFDSKALLLNYRYGHLTQCAGNYGVDRLTKEFKVTEENLEFTVWFAVVLENPEGHLDNQPFFSITCDRAPDYDFCFDADLIDCEDTYVDENCTYTDIDLLDWSCHRIKLPESMIDSIATLEITVGDCGQGGHRGYAFIDGICEDCAGSALGSVTLSDTVLIDDVGIDYISCNGDSAVVCGSYSLPTICGDLDELEIDILGITVTAFDVDTTNKTFCFNVPQSILGAGDCTELFASITYSNGFDELPPVISNTIEVCKSDYDSLGLAITVGECQPQTSVDDDLSNQYYFVTIDVYNTKGESWILNKQLLDPYPNESGLFELYSGTGDTTIVLGPFLIQEGDWLLTLVAGDCDTTEEIIAPDYCSSCNLFNELEISNITCISQTNWSFDILVPGNSANNFNFDGTTYSYDDKHTINVGSISGGCETYDFFDAVLMSCAGSITICPPKPCPSGQSCDLEVYLKDYDCTRGVSSYDIELYAKGTNYMCYEAKNSGGTVISSGSLSDGFNTLGSFSESLEFIVWECTNSNCNSGTCQATPTCYKSFYVPLLDCEDPVYRSSKELLLGNKSLIVYPNPFYNNFIKFSSKLNTTEFGIFDISGNLILQSKFDGPEKRYEFDAPSGIYFVRYLNERGHFEHIKIIKI